MAPGRSTEAVAGQEIRRLRIARGWSQQEVAARMRGFGYSWNQTMVSKIEAGTRPLRVNELADLAELFAVHPAALLKPWSEMSLEDVYAAIAELEPALKEAQDLAERGIRAQQEAFTIEARLTALKQRRDFLAGQDGEGK